MKQIWLATIWQGHNGTNHCFAQEAFTNELLAQQWLAVTVTPVMREKYGYWSEIEPKTLHGADNA